MYPLIFNYARCYCCCWLSRRKTIVRDCYWNAVKFAFYHDNFVYRGQCLAIMGTMGERQWAWCAWCFRCNNRVSVRFPLSLWFPLPDIRIRSEPLTDSHSQLISGCKYSIRPSTLQPSAPLPLSSMSSFRFHSITLQRPFRFWFLEIFTLQVETHLSSFTRQRVILSRVFFYLRQEIHLKFRIIISDSTD